MQPYSQKKLTARILTRLRYSTSFKKMGLVKFEKSGRIKKVMLTDDGWDIAHNLEAIIKKFNQIEASLEQEQQKKK